MEHLKKLDTFRMTPATFPVFVLQLLDCTDVLIGFIDTLSACIVLKNRFESRSGNGVCVCKISVFILSKVWPPTA